MYALQFQDEHTYLDVAIVEASISALMPATSKPTTNARTLQHIIDSGVLDSKGTEVRSQCPKQLYWGSQQNRRKEHVWGCKRSK